MMVLLKFNVNTNASARITMHACTFGLFSGMAERSHFACMYMHFAMFTCKQMQVQAKCKEMELFPFLAIIVNF